MRYCMLRASSLSLSPRRQMAAEENKMADSRDRPTPHHATMYDQSYHTRTLSRNIWFIPQRLRDTRACVRVRTCLCKCTWVNEWMCGKLRLCIFMFIYVCSETVLLILLNAKRGIILLCIFFFICMNLILLIILVSIRIEKKIRNVHKQI